MLMTNLMRSANRLNKKMMKSIERLKKKKLFKSLLNFKKN